MMIGVKPNNMEKQTVTIELTVKDCALFKLFQEHYEFFRILIDAGLFTIKQGSIDIHFDTHGNIGAIDIHHNTYRRRLTDRITS